MSAQVALLRPNLQQAVSLGAISLAEAWAFQDLLSMSPQDSWVEAPDCLQPMLNRLWLLETQPRNQLPI